MLTDAVAKAAGAQPRAYKLTDQGGMHLLVRPTGSKSWQQKYRWRGRERLLTLGRFPEVSVPRARILQAEAKAQIEQGVDPASVRIAVGGDTFESVARRWARHNRSAWSPEHNLDVIESLERDVFPAIGAKPISELGAAELLEVLKAIEARGARETAGRVRQRISAVFEFAMASELVAADPAAKLGRALRGARLSVPHPALLAIADCRSLLAACENAPARPATVLASRFLALTAVRLAAVRGMRWAEVDLDGAMWTVPAARMKLARAKKDDARFDHAVPLSDEALFVLRGAAQLQSEVEPGNLVFPGRAADQPIGEGAIRELYRRAGYGARHVPHGWRASFSTILNEELGEEWRLTIDLALAHSAKGKVEGAYNRAQLLGRRRELMDRWGAMLAA